MGGLFRTHGQSRELNPKVGPSGWVASSTESDFEGSYVTARYENGAAGGGRVIKVGTIFFWC